MRKKLGCMKSVTWFYGNDLQRYAVPAPMFQEQATMPTRLPRESARRKKDRQRPPPVGGRPPPAPIPRMDSVDSGPNGVGWVLCAGSMWNQLPERFGKWNSGWWCYSGGCGHGAWAWALERLSDVDRSFAVFLASDITPYATTSGPKTTLGFVTLA